MLRAGSDWGRLSEGVSGENLLLTVGRDASALGVSDEVRVGDAPAVGATPWRIEPGLAPVAGAGSGCASKSSKYFPSAFRRFGRNPLMETRRSVSVACS